MMRCMYCQIASLNYAMFIVREAVKPPRTPKRWKVIGHCCDFCERVGKPIEIDKYKEKEKP